MTTSGFAPAGGWVVPVSIIKATESPTARPSDQGETPQRVMTLMPVAVVRRCPSKILRGCARGLCGRANSITMVAPKGAISHNSGDWVPCRLLRRVMQAMAPSPAIREVEADFRMAGRNKDMIWLTYIGW